MPITGESENASGGSGKAIDLAKVNNGTEDVGRQITSTGDPINWDKVQRVDADGAQVKILDGSDLTLGTKADTAATDTTSSWTAISLLKGILAALRGSLAVTGTFWQAVQPVSGTFWQATQPVSVADGQDIAQGTTSDLATASTAIGLLKAIKAAVQSSIAVTGTFWQATQPVSGTFWQAKQPISVADGDDATQGAKADAASPATDTTAITAMSVWKQISKSVQAIATSVAGTLTATVSGTVTANAGTNLNTSSLALETGGNLAASKADLDTLAALFTATSPARNVPANRNATGNLTASGQTVAIDTTGMATCYFSYSGIFNGSIITEAFDGTNWVTIAGYVLSSTQYVLNPNPLESIFSGNNKTSTTLINCAGFQQIRARCTSFTSGSAAVILNAAPGIGGLPTKLVGDEGNSVKADGNGSLYTNIQSIGGISTGNAPTDGQSAAGLLPIAQMAFNGTTWDRIYNAGNAITVLTSAARAIDTAGSPIPALNYKGVLLVLSVTAGTPNLRVQLVSGNNSLSMGLSTNPVLGNGTFGYLYYPGIAVVANAAATNTVVQTFSTIIAGPWSGYVAVSGGSTTFSLTAYPIP